MTRTRSSRWAAAPVLDAAKLMKLKYESPEADLEELAAPFLDIRKRVVQYPDGEAQTGSG